MFLLQQQTHAVAAQTQRLANQGETGHPRVNAIHGLGIQKKIVTRDTTKPRSFEKAGPAAGLRQAFWTPAQ